MAVLVECPRMDMLPTDDLGDLETRFEAAAEVLLADNDAGSGPAELVSGMRQTLDILRRYQADQQVAPMSADDLTEIGDYGLQLLMGLAAQAGERRLADTSREFEDLALPLGLWVASHGGRLVVLEPVVNALAQFANSLREPRDLEQLFERTGAILEAVDPDIRQDLDNTNPQRPWRVLLINRAIVATRSYMPELMARAFDDLVQYLPADAPRFFTEGMEQMEALGYPPHVREVMERYHHDWHNRHTLH